MFHSTADRRSGVADARGGLDVIRPLLAGLCGLLLMGSAVVNAEDAAAPATAESDQAVGLQEVVVTGSRIPVPGNITSTSPIAAISAQQIALQGQTDATSIINQLPQNVISEDSDLGNNQNALTAAGGVATADLRGLGPQRTLVLVDGKRLFAGDPNSENPNPAADLDQIPAAMIERVDVVTGGASAVYGSDAVAGVINFITKKNFQGIEIDGQYGFFQHNNNMTGIQSLDASTQAAVGPTSPTFTAPSGSVHDGYKHDLSLIMGTNVADGAGNITAYATYHHQDPITNGERDFSNCQLVSNESLVRSDFDCIGTSNSNYFQPKNGPNAQSVYSVVGTSFLPYPQVGSNPPFEFQPNPYIYMQRQDERWNTGFNAHIDLNDHVKPYLIGTFMDDRTTEIVGPSAAFKASYPYSADNFYRVNCTNPLLSAQEQATLCSPAMITADTPSPGNDPAGLSIINIGRRNVEGGGRVAFYDHTNFRIAAGSTGDILPGVSYDAYAQYYYTTLFNSNTDYLNYQNIGQSLLATGTAAAPVCTNTTGGCVPWNIFTQGGVNAAQLGYLQSPGTGYGTDSETITHVDITAELGQYGLTSPLAHEGLAVNVGGEHRGDTFDFSPDAVEQSGALSGFSGAVAPIHAALTVDEGFFEVRAPLIQDHMLVKDLSIDGGYRYSNYSTAGPTRSWKFEVQYAPIADARLRFSYDRAVRAPNLFELFSPQSYGQTTVVGNDPCAGAAPTASLATCMRTGVTAAEYGTIPQCTSAQCGQVIGGNPKLLPEEADTYSIGITLTPTMLPNFTASIDYWHIAQFGLIGPVPANVLFQNCLTEGLAFDCSQVVRNPVTGALTGATVAGGGYVLQTDINSGSGLTSGVDVSANYRQSIGRFGALVAIFNGTYLEHSVTTPYPGSGSYDCAGLYGPSCNTNSVNPRWRHTLRLNWEAPWSKLVVSANWRFIGATTLDNNSTNPLLQGATYGQFDVPDERIPSFTYLDLAVIWPVWRDIQIRAGANNVLDKNPPVVSSELTGTGSSNTYPSYDLLGRELFVGFTAKF
ncbi:MAG TPA: TonB-dependent receptor [Steroidobacteraceae bacterium]|jgi:outer membrane receptor protein involved in Fe transport